MKKYTILVLSIFSLSFAFISPAFAASFSATVTGDILYVRSGPGTGYKKVTQLKKGKSLTVLETKNGWYRIGKNQWVIAKFVKKSTVAKASSSVKVAKTTVAKSAPRTTTAEETDPFGNTTAPVQTSSVTVEKTNPSANCMAEIMKANSYCSKVTAGCHTYSTSEHCVEANKMCAERQQSAMDLCPAAN